MSKKLTLEEFLELTKDAPDIIEEPDQETLDMLVARKNKANLQNK